MSQPTYNRQQEAIILKGIASQILSMNVPSYKEVNKLLLEFNFRLEESFIKQLINILSWQGVVKTSGSWFYTDGDDSSPYSKFGRISGDEVMWQDDEAKEQFFKLVARHL